MKRMSMGWCQAGVLLVGMLLGGCVKPPVEGRADPFAPPQVAFASDELRRETAIQTPVVKYDAAGLMRVMLPIRAATDLQLYIEYRVTFFDESQQVVWQSGWLAKTLAPNVPDQIVFNSPSPRARDFRLDIRFGRLN